MASFFRQTPLPTSAFKSRSSSSTNGSTPSSSKNTSLGGAGGPSTPSPASSIHRRVSRTDLDFEQALKGGGTVLIKEGVDIQSLGKSPISPGVNTPTTAGGFGSSSSGFPRFNTPIVVPPTPSPMQAQPPPPIVDISAAEGEEGEEEEDHEVDIDLQTKRRSMFRSPGTSSSPDLATLVRKAKARGGVVGMSLNDEGGGVQETQMALAPPSSFHAMLSPTPEQKRGRSNSTTSSAISSTDSSSQKQGTKGFKADKLLGVEGGVGNDRSRMLMRDGGKTVRATMKSKTSALWGKMIGSSTVREKRDPSPMSTYVPPPLFAGMTDPKSPPPPPLYAHFAKAPRSPHYEKEQPSPPLNDVFSSHSPNLAKPLPPIYKPRSLMQDSEDEEDGDHFVTVDVSKADPSTPGKGKEWGMKTITANSTLKQNRRRSMSVGDVIVVSPASPPSSEQSSLKGPSLSTSSSAEWMGDIDIGDTASDFSGAFAGLTAPSTPSTSTSGSGSGTTRSGSRGTGRPSILTYVTENQLLPTQTPSRSNTIKGPSHPNPPSQDPDVSDLSMASYTTGRTSPSPTSDAFFTPPTTRPSAKRVRPLPPTPKTDSKTSDASLTPTMSPPQGSKSVRPVTMPILMTTKPSPSPATRRPASTASSPTTNPRVNALRQNHTPSHPPPASSSGRSRNHLTSPSAESLRAIVQPRSAASNSEPALVNNGLSPVYPRLSLSTEDDENGKGYGGAARTVRLVSSGTGLGLGIPSLDDMANGHVPARTNSGSKSMSLSVAGLSEEELAEKGKDLASKCWNEDESFLGREKIAEWLGGMDKIKKVALKYYMDFFDFTSLRLDHAFRRLCAKLYLKAETQQVDRILEEFSRRYFECNPNVIYGSIGVVHQVCYSLLLLNTDLHVAELASHMSRNQFVRNTIDTIRSQSQDDKGNQSDLALNSARASSPEPVPTTEDNASVYSVSINGSDARGSVSDSGTTHTIRKSRRSESITSKRSNPIMSLSTPMASSANHSAGSGSDPTDFARRPSIQVHGTTSSGTSTVYDRNWETEMETMLKDMYAAVKSQQILQPLNGSSSLSPGTQYGGSLTRTRSQRSTGPPDRLATLKRGSIRGIQTLLGSQSPYSNSSGSIDGRISPSPSFATSIGDQIYNSSSTLFTPTLGFASNLSHSIIKEGHEDDSRSIDSDDSVSTTASITDEELALLGPPWAKEGMLARKQYWELTGKRAKNKNWMDVFVVIQKGELSMFTFGEGNSGAAGGAGVGGGNWLSNAKPVGEVVLAHSLAHALPPPGYNRQRPYCFVLTLASGAVYFFQAGTEDLVNEWVSTCNYWAARQSREPLSGGVSNMEYGWNRATDSYQQDSGDPTDNFSDTFSIRSGRSKLSKKSAVGSIRPGIPSPWAMEKIYINDWKPPLPPSIASTHDEETQMEALQKQVANLKEELKQHNDLQQAMISLYSPRSNNAAKAMANWERKSQHLLTEIVKYDSYLESLRHAMSLRLKKRGERVLERTLIVSSPDPDQKEFEDDPVYLSTPNSLGSKGLREETIQEAEEPKTPVPGAEFPPAVHRRESAGVEDVKE